LQVYWKGLKNKQQGLAKIMKRAKRILRIFLWILVCAIILFLLLHTPPARNLIKRVLSRTVSARAGGSLEIGRISYKLWRGEVTLEEVAFENPILRADADRLEASLFSRGGLRIKVDNPTLFIRDTARESQPAARRSPPPWMLLQQIGAVDVEKGRLGWGSGAAAGAIEGSLSLRRRLSAIPPRVHSFVLTGDLQGRVGEFDPIPMTVSASAGLQSGSLQVDEVRVESHRSFLSAQGALSQAEFIFGDLTGGFEIDASLVRSFSPDLPIQERIAGSFVVNVKDSGTSNRIRIEIPRVFVAGSGPWNVLADARLEGRTVYMDSWEAAGYQGSLKARGTADFGRKEVEAEIEAQGLDVSSLASVWTELPFPIASRVGAEARFSLQDWDVAQAEAQGLLRIETLPAEGVPVSGSVDFRLKDHRLSFDSRSLRIFDSRMKLSGEMGPDTLQARYELQFPLSDLPSLLEAAVYPVLPVETGGFLLVSGELTGDPHDVFVAARATGEHLRIGSKDYGASAAFELDRNTFRIQEAEIASGGGKVRIEGQIPIGSSGENWDVSARLEALNLADFAGDLGYDLPAEGALAIRGEPGSPVWEVAIWAPVFDQGLSTRAGSLSIKARGRGTDITLDELSAELGGGSLMASGQYQTETRSLRAQMKGNGFRLEEIRPLTRAVDGLKGTVSFDAALQGSAADPRVELNVNLDDPVVHDSPLPDLKFVLESGGEKADFKGYFGERFLSGSLGLQDSLPLQLEVDISTLPIQEFLAGFPDLSPIKVLSAEGMVEMDLPLRDPSALSYRAEIGSITGVYGSRSWQISPFSIDGGHESLSISGFRLMEGNDSLAVDGRVPLKPDADIDLNLQGTADLGLAGSLLPDSEVEGEAEFQLHIQGTPAQPRARGDASVSECRGRWGDLSWENFELRLTGNDEGIQLDSLKLNTLGGSIDAKGHLFWTPTGIDSRLAFRVDRLNLGSLLPKNESASAPAVRVSGEGELAANEYSLSRLTGSGTFTACEADIEGSSVSLQDPVRWTLESGTFSHSPIHFFGDRIDLNTAFSFDARTTPPDWRLEVQGKVDPALANPFIPDNNIRLSRETDVKIDISSRDGNLSGRAVLTGSRLSLREPAMSISRIEIELTLQDRLLEITRMQGEVGSGRIRISGQIAPDDTGKFTAVDLHIKAEDVPLNMADGIYGRISGDTRLEGAARNYTLSGSVLLPSIVYQQELTPSSESLIHLERQLRSLEEPSLLEFVSLDLRAEVLDLQVENSIARFSAEGSFQLKGTLLMPDLDGSIRIKKGGSIQIGRGRVQIEEGGVTFADYPDRPLDVRFSGISQINGIYIELDVRGPTDDLQTQISAPFNADLTQGDLVVLLMTGRTSSRAVSEAGAIVAEELAAGVGDILQSQLGENVYVDISSDQSMFSYGSDPTTRFSLGHRVAPNLYVIYARALNGTQSRGILDYHPPQPVRLRYIVEEDGRHVIEANHTLGIRLRPLQTPDLKGKKVQRRIGQLSFEGERPIDLKELRKLARQKPGKRYNEWEAYRGAVRIRDRLMKLGYRGAQVEFEERPASTEKMDVTYFLEPGKRIHIEWAGDLPSRRIRSRIEALWDGRLAEDAQAETLARRTEHALKAERYFLARVTPIVAEKENELFVQYRVSAGPKGQTLSLVFEGNAVLPDERLEAVLPKVNTADFFASIAEDSRLLRRDIHVLYASEGFLQGRVEDIRTRYAEENQELLVTLILEEGPRAVVESLSLPPETAEARGLDAIPFRLRADVPFRIEDYLKDRTALTNFYRRQGFAQPQVSGMLKPVDNRIAVVFTADTGPRSRVGRINLARPSRFRLSRLKNTLSLKEGDLITPSEMALSRNRLLETRAFQSVDIQTVASDEGPEIQDLVVDLIDKPEVELSYGIRYTLANPVDQDVQGEPDYGPFELGGGVRFLNPFGLGHRYGAASYVFGKNQFYRLYFESDFFFGLRLPSQVILSQDWLRYIQISGLNSRVNRITFQQYYRLGESPDLISMREKLRLQWNYSFRHIRLSYQDDLLPPYETDRGSLSLSLIGDTRDNFVNAERGAFWSLSSELAQTWLGSEVDFIKLFGQAYLHVPLGGKVIWASGLRLGAVPGDNPLLIIEDRFLAGGVYSVRGFPLNYLGPKTELGEPTGGQAVVIFNQELRFPLYRSLHGGIFYDAGNVFALADQMSLRGLRHSAGVGLRYVLPFGPIRLDWAYVLDPKPGEDKYRFAFTIGHVF
jgi:outer membrane protein assembly complex protein YaeT